MALRVRDFLARVMVARPDVFRDKGEEYGLWCIRETVRRICRDTTLAVEDLGTIVVLANTHSVTLTSAGNEIGMVKSVTTANMPGDESNPTTYAGVFDASTGDITPHNGSVEKIITGNANLFDTNSFYVCSTAGILDVDNLSNPQFEVGDVILSNGVNWLNYKADAFNTARITSKMAVDHWVTQNQRSRAMSISVAQEGDVLTLYPPPKYDTVITVHCSVVPNLMDWTQTVPQEIELVEIPLPISAENAILFGSLEMLFNTPGPDGMSNKFWMSEADKYRVMFMKEMTGLRAISLLGQSGAAWYIPSNFAGRTNRVSPWRSTNW